MTNEELTEHVVGVWIQHGQCGVTYDRVMAAAGVSRGMISHRYGNAETMKTYAAEELTRIIDTSNELTRCAILEAKCYLDRQTHALENA